MSSEGSETWSLDADGGASGYESTTSQTLFGWDGRLSQVTGSDSRYNPSYPGSASSSWSQTNYLWQANRGTAYPYSTNWSASDHLPAPPPASLGQMQTIVQDSNGKLIVLSPTLNVTFYGDGAVASESWFVSNNGSFSEAQTFDEAGHLLAESGAIVRSGLGTLDSHTSWTYGSNGPLSSVGDHQWYSDFPGTPLLGADHAVETYHYDGRLLRSVDGVDESKSCPIVEQGGFWVDQSCTTTSSPLPVSTYAYDVNGYVNEKTITDSAGNVLLHWIGVNDSAGNLLCETQVGSGDAPADGYRRFARYDYTCFAQPK